MQVLQPLWKGISGRGWKWGVTRGISTGAKLGMQGGPSKFLQLQWKGISAVVQCTQSVGFVGRENCFKNRLHGLAFGEREHACFYPKWIFYAALSAFCEERICMVILTLLSCLVKSERKFVYATGKSIAVAGIVQLWKLVTTDIALWLSREKDQDESLRVKISRSGLRLKDRDQDQGERITIKVERCQEQGENIRIRIKVKGSG